MTVEEAKSILGKIKVHYPEFSSDKNTQKEWIKELVLYDSKDVNNKLLEHLKNQDYGDKIPKLFFLTSRLIPTEEKGKVRHYVILCPHCESEVSDVEFEKHSQRCIEASTMVRDMKKYFNQALQKKKIMELDDKEFNRIYDIYADKMLESPKVSSLQKRVLMHIKYPNYSSDDITEIVKEMAG